MEAQQHSRRYKDVIPPHAPYGVDQRDERDGSK